MKTKDAMDYIMKQADVDTLKLFDFFNYKYKLDEHEEMEISDNLIDKTIEEIKEWKNNGNK